MIRILHVVTYMGRGGLETMIMNYYRAIDREKIQFDFLVHREFEADYEQEILSLGGKIYRVPNLNPFSRNYLKQLDTFFEHHKEYKIVHSHLDCMAGIPLKYAKKHDIPIRIAHSHNSNQTKDKKFLIKLLFKRNIKKHATQLFACSKTAGQWMFQTEEFQILNNAIDAHAYQYNEKVSHEVRNELGIADDAIVVGHVGLFRPQKNHLFLINVFHELLKKEPDCVLLLIGDGDEYNNIKALVEKLNISDQVILTGVRSDIAKMMQAMDIFVFPSLFEGLPVTMIEAQAAGLPCVISDGVPLACKLTDNVKQIKLKDSLQVWANAILSFKKFPHKDTTEEITKAGFDIKTNAKWLERFYLDGCSR